MARLRIGHYVLEVTVTRLQDSLNNLAGAVSRIEARWPAGDGSHDALVAQVTALQQQVVTLEGLDNGYADVVDQLAVKLDGLGAAPPVPE